MMRVSALKESGGFNETMIAGEEPELCIRLVNNGWKIYRMGVDMALHDADMTRFSQWWKRSVRGGHAYAERRWLHRHDQEPPLARETRSMAAYGLVLPLMIAALAWPTHGWSLVLLGAYPVLVVRIRRHLTRRGFSSSDAWIHAGACTIIKVPQVAGWLQFHLNRLVRKRSSPIEYK